jgi:hypothetical protein
MTKKTIFFFGFAFASIAVADAQFSDGTYKGSVHLTKDVEHMPNADYCTPTGGQLEFRVSGDKIGLYHERTGKFYFGALPADGNFRISFQHPAGKTNKWINSDWKGRLKGPQIDGNSVGLGPGRDCYHSFSAKKVGSLSR